MTLFYNGIQYEVEQEGDDIEPINVLADEENEHNMKVSNNSKDFEESYWTTKATHLFLDECIKRKMLIRDPNIRSHKVFLAIHERMKAKGYIFKVISLERKLRTMKKHYSLLHENNQNPSMKRTHWPYYGKMETLYPEPDCFIQESNKESQALAEAQQVQQPSHARKRPRKTLVYPSQQTSVAEFILEENLPSVLLPLTIDRKERYQTNRDNNNDSEPSSNNIKLLRKEMLAMEERRTAATEQILIELRKTNKIKGQMLDVNIKIFEASKELEDNIFM